MAINTELRSKDTNNISKKQRFYNKIIIFVIRNRTNPDKRKSLSGYREVNGGLVLKFDGLVLWNKGLHDAPANEVGNGTDAEHNHVGSRLALETEEREVGALSGCPVEELTRTEVNAHRTDTAGHGAQTNDGADSRLGEHVANGREEVG